MNEKVRLQVYYPNEHFPMLLEDAERRGISAAAMLVEIALEHYGKRNKAETESNITTKVKQEFAAFCLKSAYNTEFTIAEASPTFASHPEYRALLGKKIAVLVADGEFGKNITASRTRSGSVRRRRNGAAVYLKKPK